jgi:hypothetical protein
MEDRAILCDSSSLISLSDSCLDSVFPFLAKRFGVKFVIPPSVEYETVIRPLTSNLREYAFSAIKIRKMVETGVINKVDADVKEKARSILSIANNLLYVKGRPFNLVHYGEAEMLALGNELGVRNILIDERTTRMLIEAPFQIKEHMEMEFKVSIMLNENNLHEFASLTRNMESIRSSELIIVAWENGLFDDFGAGKKAALEAALYKIKFSGCSIRFDEVEDYMKSVAPAAR